MSSEFACAINITTGRFNIIRLEVLIGLHLIDTGSINHTLAAHFSTEFDIITSQLYIIQLNCIVCTRRARSPSPCQMEEAHIILRGDLLCQFRNFLIQHAYTSDPIIICQHFVKSNV